MALSTIKRNNQTVDSTSSDYEESRAYWEMVRTMMRGTRAMRKAGQKYLPKFESETLPQYRQRVGNAKYTNIFSDIVKNLADRPFAKEPAIKAVPAIEPLLENIDGQNNHVSIFMAEWFKEAITTGIEWCLVDYATANPWTTDASGVERRKSVAEERQEGARPYCLLVKPEDLIAVYSGMISGQEKIVHARIREIFKVRDEWNEVTVERIRVLNRQPILDANENIVGYEDATYQIWERKDNQAWGIIQEGDIFIKEIALVPLIIGTRETGWLITADMTDCADLQLEYYEQENGLKNVKTLTAYPMLSASGVDPEIDPKTKRPVQVPVGPRAILYGGSPKPGSTVGGDWKWIEFAGTSVNFLKEDLKELAKEIRELGRQPLTASSSNITKETSAFASAKGKSAIRRWAGSLKDAMENVLMYMAMWESVVAEPEVTLNLDDIDEADGDTGMSTVDVMYEKQVISKKTYREEAMRRNILSDNFDPDKEDEQIESEVPDDPSLEDETLGVTLDPNGNPIPDSPSDEDEEDSPAPSPDP